MRRLIFLAVMIIVVLTNVSGPNLSQAEPLSSARSGTSTPSIIKLTPMKAQAPAYGSAPTRTFYDALPVPTPDSFIVNKIGPATQPTNMVGAKDNETALWSEPAPSFAPTTLALLKKEVDHYASLAAAGGWPRVPQAVAADPDRARELVVEMHWDGDEAAPIVRTGTTGASSFQAKYADQRSAPGAPAASA
jgi:hypothetical protein